MSLKNIATTPFHNFDQRILKLKNCDRVGRDEKWHKSFDLIFFSYDDWNMTPDFNKE